MNENWTDDLRQQMEQYESTQVPEGLWEGIEECLDNSPRAVVVPMWRRWAAACVAIGIVGVAGMLYFMKGNDDKTVMTTTTEHLLPKQNAGGRNTQIFESKTGKTYVSPLAQAKTHRVPEAKDEHINIETDVPAGYNDSVTPTKHDATEQHPTDILAEDKHSSTPESYQDVSGLVPLRGRKDVSGGDLRIALYASQMPQTEHLGMNGYLALSEYGTPDNTPHMLSKGNKGNMDYLALANDGSNPKTDVHHQLPVRIGFSLGYDINRRWGVNIGVAYTKLKSTLTAGTYHSYYSNDQTIKYIGVPISATYNLLRNRHLRLYATAGAMAEFGIGGETIVKTTTKNHLVATERHEMDDIPMQLSADIGGGAELNIYRSLGIFAEVGAAYYFDNNSKYSTIYSAHPLNLNLQFGVRWTINSTE